MIVPTPPKLEDRQAGTVLCAGLSASTIYADFDFETYSEAGYEKINGIYQSTCNQKTKKGLSVVGAMYYAQHPSTDILSLAYNLKDGTGPQQWYPGKPLPEDLFYYLKLHNHYNTWGIIEAWNVNFEYLIWQYVAVKKYNFPQILHSQLRCAMAKAKAFSLPAALDNTAKVLKLENKKDKEGKRLLNKFSVPDKIKGRVPLFEIGVIDSDSLDLLHYNLQDIKTEAEASSRIPDLSYDELQIWLCDLTINNRGIQIDIESINAIIKIIEQAEQLYNQELLILTEGQVDGGNKVAKLIEYINNNSDLAIYDLTAETVETLLKKQLSPKIHRILEIRSFLSMSSVKKVYAIRDRICNNRIHGLFLYYGAHTGRWSGMGPQPQNLPSNGPVIYLCEHCNLYQSYMDFCKICSRGVAALPQERNFKAVEQTLALIQSKDFSILQTFFKDPLYVISGCLRSLFIAAPNHDLICSDYSAIEAVVLACLSGEQWRIDVFKTHGKIYELSGSKITGVPFEQINSKHEARRIGKVAELASGYQGWIGAWKRFKADQFMDDDQIKQAVLAWRAASPAIVDMWNNVESCAHAAVIEPCKKFLYRDIAFISQNNVLYIILPSGRSLVYHNPRLSESNRLSYGSAKLQLSYEIWSMNPPAWIRTETYGGKLTENIVQAVARDILAHAIVNLERLNYPVVLHVHDEIVCEVPEDYGSIEEMENIMMTLPNWCKDWPIKAAKGWRGKRYRK